MGVAVHFAAIYMASWLSAPWLAVRAGSLVLLVLVGMVTFAVFTQLSGGSDLVGILKALRRRNT